MNIFAVQTVEATCPPGCGGHVPADDGQVHISVEQTVVATSGPERTEIYVSREMASGRMPAVRVQGAGDAPMQPAEAMQLAAALIVEALAAMSWQVTR